MAPENCLGKGVFLLLFPAILFGNHVIKNVASGKDSTATTRSFASTAWLLGSPSIWGSTPILTTPNRNYTANDYKAIFDAIEYKNGYQMYLGITDLNKGYPAPNVPVYCFDNFRDIGSEYWSALPASYKRPGNGVVNLRSLEVCLKWKKEQKYTFSTGRQFSGKISLRDGEQVPQFYR